MARNNKWMTPLLITGLGVTAAVYWKINSGPTPGRGEGPPTPARLLAPIDTTPAGPVHLVAQRILRIDGTSVVLNVPDGYDVGIAAEGLGRVRFMARSPDGRIFAPDMVNLSDNRNGCIWILADFDPATSRFRTVSPYLKGLRNPNSVAFHTDPQGQTWLYLALTDRLLRFPYQAGDQAPSGQGQVLATFPDTGQAYKNGGWHLTRTITFGRDGPDEALFVSVGSSCNACEEREPVRACILRMNPDGSDARLYARGLRNAVGLKWVDSAGALFATNMGVDHLGDDVPDDTLQLIEPGKHYGWPYCYQHQSRMHADPRFNPRESKLAARAVPLAHAAFPAHSAPLGIEYFDSSTADPRLRGSFLAALHGASKPELGRGYSLVRVKPDGTVEDFLTGFLTNGKVSGRPCDVLRLDARTILLSDDHAGLIYVVSYRQ